MAPTTSFKPNLLKSDSLPAHDNQYRELQPYLLNGKVLYRVGNSDQFISAELLHPTPTGKDLVQIVQNDSEGLLQAQDNLIAFLRTDHVTELIAEAVHTAIYEYQNGTDDDSSDQNGGLPTFTPSKPLPAPTQATTPAGITNPPSLTVTNPATLAVTNPPTLAVTNPPALATATPASPPSVTIVTKHSTRSGNLSDGVRRFVANLKREDAPPPTPSTIRQSHIARKTRFLDQTAREQAYAQWHRNNHSLVLRKNIKPHIETVIALAKTNCGLKPTHRFNPSENAYLHIAALELQLRKSRYTYRIHGLNLALADLRAQCNGVFIHADVEKRMQAFATELASYPLTAPNA